MKKNIVIGLLLSFLLLLSVIFPVWTESAIYDPSPADNDTRLITDEDSRNTCNQENCIPLILIHGIHGNQTPGGEDDLLNPYRDYWLNLLNFIYTNSLADNYKIYRFHYISDIHPVSDISKALRNKIDNHTDSGAFPNKKLVIVAHSMGGLVARSYMNEWPHLSPNAPDYQGRLAGERVLKLITLATPHHGTPMANNEPRFNGLVDLAWDGWSKIDDAFYWGITSNCWTCVLDPDDPNRAALRWDNFDGIWDDIPNEYINDDVERNDWLRNLNNILFYDNKIIAYYGYIGNDPEVDLYGDMDAGTFHWYLVVNSLLPSDLLRQNSSTALRFLGVLLERIFQPYNTGVIVSYLFNDGMVPTQSARFTGHTLSKRIGCPGHDHEDMKDGGVGYCTTDKTLYVSLKDDLLDIATPPNITISFPTDGLSVSNLVTVTVNVSDDVSKVEFYLDNVLKLTDYSLPYSWSWDTTNDPNGSYSLMAKAYDLADNEGVSPTITVTVDNTSGNNPPNTPTFFGQFKSDGTGIGFGGTTDERSVVLKGDVTDPDGDWVSLDVEVRLVGTAFYNSPNCSSSGTVPSGGTAAATCSALADGQYHWQARAKDSDGAVSGWLSAGGNSESNADFIVSAGSTVINYPPSVTIISPNGGETLIAGSFYTISWIAIDDQNVELVTLSYSEDGGNNWTGIPGAVFLDNPGSYQWTVPNITSTTVKVKAIAFDGELTNSDISDGNFSIVSSCAVPSTPTLQSISPSGSSYTVSWTAVSDITHYNLQQDTSSSFTSPSVVYTSNGTSWYSGEKLPDTYYYRVKAINSCGGSEWSNIQSVTIQADQGPGAITALSPADNATNQPLSITLSWSASHPGGESLRYNVYVVPADTTIFYPNNIQSYEQTGTTFALSNLPYNTVISWGIEAIDDTGDRKYSQMFHFTTIGDNTAPTGSITINNGDASTISYSVTLNLSATDSDSGVRYMRFSNDGASWTYWKPYGTQYAWNLADPNYGGLYGLSTYTVYAQYRDYEDNESGVYQDSITKEAGTPGQILFNGDVYETIQDAIDAAGPGDIVYLTEGVYDFEGDVFATNHPTRTTGIQMKPGVTLMGAGADKTVIDVRGFAFAAIIDADNSVIEGLTVINTGSLSWRYVVLLESDSSKIKNCIIKGGVKGVYVGWDATYSASNSEIANSLIINNTDGIWLNYGSNISIYHNTIDNNTNHGFFGWAGSAQIINNIITNNDVGVNSYDSPSTFNNNDVYGNSNANYNGSITDQTGINGNISVNPSFINPSSEDYSLNSGSPCINTGTDVGIPYNGSAPDMGAYEYNGTGIVQVTSNRTDTSFTITGPAGSYPGSGTSWSMSDLPLGVYTVTFVPIANLYLPPYQASMLYSGQTLIFDGTYLEDTVGPTGMLAVNFEEYATKDNLVSITFDIADEVAGIGTGSQMMFSNDGVTWSPAEPYSSIKKDWDLTLYGGDTLSGIKTIYAQVSDLLGNWSTLTDTILYVPDRQVLEVPTQYGTIQEAIDAAGDGDMVYVLPGNYNMRETVTLKQGVRLQGSGATETIFSDYMIFIGAANSVIDGFSGYMAINFSGVGPFIISNNWIRRGITIGWSEQQTNVIIRNNVISDNSRGVLISGTAKVLIENNTFVNNSYEAIMVSQATPNTKIYLTNNIIANNNIGVIDSNTSDTTHQHIFPSFNTYWNNTDGNFGELDPYYSTANNFNIMGPGDMDSDPMFVDASNNDFHLLNGSPSINSGDPEVKYNDPDGTRNDRGAYGGPALNTPPEADFSIEPSQGSPGTIFTFDGSLSHDGETEDNRLQVRWDIDGDGTYDTVFSTNKMFIHQYNSLGTYNVTLQVKDKGGYISTTTNTVNVINQSPNVPSNPIPADGLIDQDVNITLRWSGGDPDIGDAVTYDVYFGTTANPPLISSEQVDTFYNPGTLSSNTAYYWKIVANDSYGASSISPVWYFVTGYVDITPPFGSIYINSDAYYTNSTSVTLTLSASDESDVLEMCISNTITCTSWETYAISKLWTLSTGDGIKTVYVWFKDSVNNENTTPYSDTIILDTVSPASTITAPINGAAVIGTTYTIAGDASDIGSSVQQLEVSTDGGTIWNLATGTTSWSYEWTLPADGTYTIKSRATDSAGNIESPGDEVTVTVAIRQPTSVTINGRQILVDGEPFTIKGVGYAPTPIGDDPETGPPNGDYFTSDYSSSYDRDLPLLRQMGTNTIRLWGWNNTADHTDFLDKAYNGGNNPIYLIAGFWINAGEDIDPASPANVREQLKAEFRAMVAAHKNHPAVLMWSIGNELNADWMYGGNLDDLFSLINEMADEAHAEEGANYHPVTTALVDSDLINTIAAYDPSVPSLDIWGINVFRGNTFGTLFDDYYAVSTKPLVVLEYGIDTYDNANGDEYENIGTPYQAEYAEALWNEIAGRPDVCSGGTIMAYSDEWWKGKYSTDPGCPDYDPAFHSTCGYVASSHPDGYANEEWWGIMRTIDNGTDPDIMEPREVYYRLQALWIPPIPDIKANGSDGPLTIPVGTLLSVTVELDPGDNDGDPADWYVYAPVSPFGPYYYIYPGSWVPGAGVTYSGPLYNLTPLEVWNGSGLQIGIYTICFDVDTGTVYSDCVDVTIQ